MNESSRLTWSVRIGAGALAALALGYFVVAFNDEVSQPRVEAAWALAVVCWCGTVWRRSPTSAPHLPQPYWFYALYIAVLLPFATNWRWALAGDSLGWPMAGMNLAEHGPARSLLSIVGVAQFTYTQMALHNIFMVLVKPTLFWHRTGQVMVGALSLAAMYNVYGRLISPRFGLLVAACALATSVMIVHTYCSYPLLDAIAGGHAVLAAGLCVKAAPDSRRAWIALGALTGLLLFLTPNSWVMGLCVGAWLLPLAVWRRWPLSNILAAGSVAAVVGLPVLMQLAAGRGGALFSLVENPQYTVAKVLRFAEQAASIPFSSALESAGAFGPQLPPGFRWLFVAGIVLTPVLGRWFPGARLLFAFYIANVAFIAFTQGPYESVSVKRALVLIPMATYFVFLPFHSFLRSLPVVLTVLAVWVSFGINDVVNRIQPGRVGYTFIDGVIEANQRFADAPVCIYLSRDYWSQEFGPGGPIDRIFDIAPHVRQVSDVNDPQCHRYLCFVPPIGDALDLQALGYENVPMMNSVELRCGRRLS